MTQHRMDRAVATVAVAITHSPRTSRIGNPAAIRAALADKRLIMSRIEAAWVAAAEAQLGKHLPKGVRLDNRATWDRPTYARYLLEAEKVEPEFKPRLRRLLTEIDALEGLLSPASTASLRNVA